MRERNVLFNDALNTFYLRLYGARDMVKDHSDSEKGNPLPPHGLLFPINSKGSFICTIPTDRIAHTMAFVTPVVGFQPVLHIWCNKGRGMCYPVYGMMDIKEPLQLIGKSSSGFPLSLSEWSFTICVMPYNCK